MAAPKNAYTLRFATSPDGAITKDEAMALARARNMSLRAFILSALVHERERLRQTPLADDGPLTGAQIAWLRAEFPESRFEGEERLGSSLWK